MIRQLLEQIYGPEYIISDIKTSFSELQDNNEEKNRDFSEADIELVMEQLSCDHQTATTALIDNGGYIFDTLSSNIKKNKKQSFQITPHHIQTVMEYTDCSAQKAKEVLEQKKGNIVKTILYLI